MIAPGLHLTTPAPELWDSKRWPNFTAKELACPCGKYCQGSYYHDELFLDRLQVMRTTYGRALKINSGHRCAQHNVDVGGVPATPGKPGSQHLRIAADIDLTGHDRHRLLALAEAAGFNGIGLGLNFLHVDRRKVRTRWDYGKASRRAWAKS